MLFVIVISPTQQYVLEKTTRVSLVLVCPVNKCVCENVVLIAK